MKICVLQSAYDGSKHLLEDADPGADPSRFIKPSQHEFHHHWIKKSTAIAQIDEATAKGYDFYLNFMWGQYEDNVAGLEAIQYFELKGLPSVAQRSCVLLRSKLDFYRDARRFRAPPVPGTSQFPLFVKPATSCASMFISEKSVCHDGEELVAAIRSLDRALAPRRQEKAAALGLTLAQMEKERDIVVQEFIEGQDYSCIVIEMCDTPVALTPVKYIYPSDVPEKERFLTFDLKNYADISLHVMRRDHDPQVFDLLQKTAVEGFTANRMQGCSWCNVDIRVKANGQPCVMEVNPMPAVFMPPEHPWEDSVILKSVPGGHLALVNILIATYYLQHNRDDTRVRKIAEIYEDWTTEGYELSLRNNTALPQITQDMCAQYDFSGRVLDLGSGTGLFGRTLHSQQASQKQGLSTLTGIDISALMADESKRHGYTTVHISSLPRILPQLPARSADHVISISTLHLLSTFDLSLVLFQSFQIAEKSVTLHLDEIPEEYNNKLREAGEPHCGMVAHNHIGFMGEFGTPVGWVEVGRWRAWSWRSNFIECGVWCTVLRFERADGRGGQGGEATNGEINDVSHGTSAVEA
ncbi:MAG: hypothetical protein Q9181_006093 [Wetmoreana brouardii]